MNTKISLKNSVTMTKKGFKVTDLKRDKKIGVAAENLDELIIKSCQKLGFNVASTECRLFVAEDGTRVDENEYFNTLPPQTLFVLLKNREKMVTDFDYYYSMIRSTKKEYIETGTAAKEFLSTNIKEKLKVFQRYIAAANDARTMLSERAHDPEWFHGLELSEKTKEQSMSKRIKERMRGYYYKTKTSLQTSELYIHSKNGRGKQLIDQFLTDLHKILEMNKYNDTYFNRKAAKTQRLCNENGLFQCGGLWSSDTCIYEGEHVINPYRSREERIIFQTWNLDHKIELSRSIIPKILEAIECLYNGYFTCVSCENNYKQGVIETDRYYLQIFTQNNLKLVHIVCHYKGKHDASSDVYTLCKTCCTLPSIKYNI
ncbi:hypothetical protein ACJJTC_003916 [Scirpophaga incertulas]